ncbi:MAG TPA: DUF3488 and transglutaminase-like domain-containing protein, partial [Steroidobacteraceae bacterium]|nr:DUF3488 and transglutaminase-like domain-containing protein [Steroidobacteraceae bacterium]
MSARQALPHPLAPEQRPVSGYDVAWLVASLAIVLAPHVLHAPWWLTIFTLCLYGWRVYCSLTRTALPSRWLLLAVAALALVLVWFQSRTLFGRTAGILLLMVFSGLKLMETRNHRDAAVAVFLGYFLVITNFLFTQSMATAVGMVGALLVLTGALVAFSAPMRPARANLRTAAQLLLLATPTALVLFLLFPRVQGPLWGLPQDAYAGVSGLSDSMAPGNISQLALSDAIAFRAEFQGEPPAQRQLYWRGPVLWDFDGRTWTMGGNVLARYTPPESGGDRFRYSVLLEAHNREWLFALESAASLPDNARFSPDGQVLLQFPVRSRLRYTITSISVSETRPDESQMMLTRALRLPRNFNPRATALAQEWRATSASEPEILAKAIAFLRAGNFTYTLEPPPLTENSVDDFLFHTKAGFCEHFSSAFVFLMRAAGIPARVVIGYQGGDTNPVDRIITVRQSDAHAWAEIFVRGRGWVRVDPTAATAPGRVDSGVARAAADSQALPYLMRTELQWLRSLRYRWDALAHRWNVWVLGYNPERQRDLMSWLGMRDADWLDLASTLLAALGGFVLLLLAWMLRRMARPDPV